MGKVSMALLNAFRKRRRRVRARHLQALEIYNQLADHVGEVVRADWLKMEDLFALRFELLVLLTTSFVYQLQPPVGKDPDLSQALWEMMFEGFEYSLRQRGVMDIRIAGRMRKLFMHATGRRDAYLNGFRAQDKNTLRIAIARNVLDGALVTDQRIDDIIKTVQKILDDTEI